MLECHRKNVHLNHNKEGIGVHNARKEMNRALCKLRLCLLEKTDINFIRKKLYKILEIELDRPGALPGSCLRAAKTAIKVLDKTDHIGKTHNWIKIAIGFIEKDPMMQKEKYR